MILPIYEDDILGLSISQNKLSSKKRWELFMKPLYVPMMSKILKQYQLYLGQTIVRFCKLNTSMKSKEIALQLIMKSM